MLSSVEAWWAGLCALPFDGAQGDTPLCVTSTMPPVHLRYNRHKIRAGRGRHGVSSC
ncbi:hypothetical protein SAMN05428975_0199 [Mucilaginibacter sp. OK268]|nr:hypothetical protein SAMN05428975_0199 [Mucilaginibacter sp. OK268]